MIKQWMARRTRSVVCASTNSGSSRGTPGTFWWRFWWRSTCGGQVSGLGSGWVTDGSTIMRNSLEIVFPFQIIKCIKSPTTPHYIPDSWCSPSLYHHPCIKPSSLCHQATAFFLLAEHPLKHLVSSFHFLEHLLTCLVGGAKSKKWCCHLGGYSCCI